MEQLSLVPVLELAPKPARTGVTPGQPTRKEPTRKEPTRKEPVRNQLLLGAASAGQHARDALQEPQRKDTKQDKRPDSRQGARMSGKRHARRRGAYGRSSATAVADQPLSAQHLAAAQKLQRQLRRATPYSAEQTRAGRLICRHLVAMLKAQDLAS